MSDTCAIPATESDPGPRWPVRRVADYKRLLAKNEFEWYGRERCDSQRGRSWAEVQNLQFRPAQNRLIRIQSRKRYWPVCRRHGTYNNNDKSLKF